MKFTYGSTLGLLFRAMLLLVLPLSACNAPKQTSIPSSTIASSATPSSATPFATIQKAAGNTFYVSPSGSDSNNGSQSSPFATIQKAADLATPGTTIHVLPGTYTKIVANHKDGTAAAPIIFISDTKWGAKISTGGGLKDWPFWSNGDYVQIIGFDITSTTASDGIRVLGSHNIIQGNHVHDLKGMECSGSPGGSGMGDSRGTNNTYIGNVVNNVGSYPTECDYVHGIYVDDPRDIVENNIAYNNAGNGLYTNHARGGSITFVNNLSFANGEYGIGVNGALNGSIVENNIVVGNGIAAMKTWSTASNTKFLNNILFNNPDTFILDGGGTQQNTINADPKFVNYQANGTGDYHLKAGSPAIDAGISIDAPSTDFDNKPRPQGKGIDIGPF